MAIKFNRFFQPFVALFRLTIENAQKRKFKLNVNIDELWKI